MMIREMCFSLSALVREIVRVKGEHTIPFAVIQILTSIISLAYSEIRLIMSKLLFHFGLGLSPESANWIDQETYFLWDKPALWVTLKERF